MDVWIDRLRARSDGPGEIVSSRTEQFRLLQIFGLLKVNHPQVVEKLRVIRHNGDCRQMKSLSIPVIQLIVCLVALLVVVEPGCGNQDRVHIKTAQQEAGKHLLQPGPASRPDSLLEWKNVCKGDDDNARRRHRYRPAIIDQAVCPESDRRCDRRFLITSIFGPGRVRPLPRQINGI